MPLPSRKRTQRINASHSRKKYKKKQNRVDVHIDRESDESQADEPDKDPNYEPKEPTERTNTIITKINVNNISMSPTKFSIIDLVKKHTHFIVLSSNVSRLNL